MLSKVKMADVRSGSLSRISTVVINAMCVHVLFSLLFINNCFALYEDQVGLFDWKQQYIGNAKETFFEQTAHSGSKRIFISTDSNVLASLNARTGQLMWRKLFDRVDGTISNVFHNSELLLTVSGEGKVIRSWDQQKGHLIWESVSSPSAEASNVVSENILESFQALMLSDDNGGIVAVSQNTVKMLSQSDGSDIWSYNLPGDLGQLFGVSKTKNQVVAFAVHQKNSQSFLNFRHLDVESGDLVTDVSVPAPWITQKGVSCTIVSSKYLVCLSRETSMMFVKDYSEGNSEAFTAVQLGKLNVKQGENIQRSFIKSMSRSPDGDYFHFQVNERHHILARINPTNRFAEVVREINGAGLFTVGKLSAKEYLLEVSQDTLSHSFKVKVFDEADLQNEITTLHANVAYDEKLLQGDIIQCSVFMYSKKNDIGYRLLFSTEEHALFLVQFVGKNEGKILWVRNEALAKISAVKMIELPPSTSASKLELLHAEFSNAANSGVFTMFLNRIRSQIRQLQAFMENMRKKQRYGDPVNDSLEDNTPSDLKRDQFNIIKVILAVTEGRKLFAMNSQNGNIVWNRFLPDINKFVGQPDMELIEQRSTAHFPHPPKCVIVAPFYDSKINEDSPTASQESTAIYSFNPLTGEGVEKPEKVEPYKVIKVAELPFEDDKSAKVIGIVDTNHEFHIYPETTNTLTKLKEHMKSIYIYLVDKDTNTFKGYKIHSVAGKFKLFEVYSVFIPADQEILKIVSKRGDEVVNSVGRVLGDHSVLYKYLNPNVVALLTTQTVSNKGSLFVYIVDAVTGHVLYQARHKGAEQPADMVLSEHWLVYMYYNSKGRRVEASVVEFYEGYEEQNHTAFSSLDPVSVPMILSQGYLFPSAGITTIAATTTRHGITNKNILIGLESGRVYSLPKMFLDPRRNFKQTQILQEEGVPPYIPELPLMPQGFTNYNQTVALIRGIHTSAAGLESTSLVLVYGLDVFFTRVTPSKMFDVLKEDFDYIFISGVLSALIMATIVLGKLSTMKALKAAWG